MDASPDTTHVPVHDYIEACEEARKMRADVERLKDQVVRMSAEHLRCVEELVADKQELAALLAQEREKLNMYEPEFPNFLVD